MIPVSLGGFDKNSGIEAIDILDLVRMFYLDAVVGQSGRRKIFFVEGDNGAGTGAAAGTASEELQTDPEAAAGHRLFGASVAIQVLDAPRAVTPIRTPTNGHLGTVPILEPKFT